MKWIALFMAFIFMVGVGYSTIETLDPVYVRTQIAGTGGGGFVSPADKDLNMSYFGITDLNELNMTGNLSTPGNITAFRFIGNGSQLTDIIASAGQLTGEHWVNESGDSMSGDLNMSTNNLYDVDELWLKTGALSTRIGVGEVSGAFAVYGTTEVRYQLRTPTKNVNFVRYLEGDAHFQILTGANYNLYVFENAGNGEYPIFRWYGYPAGLSLKYGQVRIVDRGGVPVFRIFSDTGEVDFSDNNVQTTSDIRNAADNAKHYWGTSNDVACYFGGANFICNAEVGTPDYQFTGFDNVSIDGDATVDKNLYVGGNITGNQFHGEMFYHNHTGTEINFASQGVYYPLFFTNATNLNGFTFEGGFDIHSNLTAQVAGLYQAIYMASGNGQNNHEYFTTVFINDMDVDSCESHKKMTAGGDIVTMNGNCLIRLAVGDKISLRTTDYSGTGTGNYFSATLDLMMRIGN